MTLIDYVLDGRYKIKRELGKGGMGVVYLADDLQESREVAVKIMHDRFHDRAQFRERFLREAKIVSQFDHPNIVRVYEYNTDRQRAYMVMEVHHGGSLRTYLNNLPDGKRYLEPAHAVDIVRQIAQGLHYAHNNKVIHRDVKPENILLKPKPHHGGASAAGHIALLTDFGLHRLMNSADSGDSQRHLGTFPYMSPEQCAGESQSLGFGTDIYSLGIVLYEITVGMLPFKPDSIHQAFQLHNHVPVPLPGNYQPNFHSGLEMVILRCLAKDPSERYLQANALIADLDNLDFSNSVEATDEMATGQMVAVVDVQNDTNLDALEIQRRTQEQQTINQQQYVTGVQAPSPDTLVIYDQKRQPMRLITLDKTVMKLGRAPYMDIVLDNAAVSREQLRIERQANGSYTVTALSVVQNLRLGDAPLAPNKAVPWPGDVVLHLPPYQLQLERQAKPDATGTQEQPLSLMSHAPMLPNPMRNHDRQARATQPMTSAEMLRTSQQQFDPARPSSPVRVALLGAQLSIMPGEQGTASLQLANTSGYDDEFEIDVRGIPGDWAVIEPAYLALPSGESTTVLLNFMPPRRWHSRAGKHNYTLRVRSMAQSSEVALLTGEVHLKTFVDFTASLMPERLRSSGVATVMIENRGNVAVDFKLSAQAREDGLHCQIRSNFLRLDAGQEKSIEVTLQPDERHLVHGANVFNYVVKVSTSEQQEKALWGQMIVVSNRLGQPQASGISLEQVNVQAVFPFSTPDVTGYALPAAQASPPNAHPLAAQAYTPPVSANSSPQNRRQNMSSSSTRRVLLRIWIVVYVLFGLLGLVLVTNTVSNIVATNDSTLLQAIAGVLGALAVMFLIVYGILLAYAWRGQRWAMTVLITMSLFLLPVGPILALIWWLLTRENNEDLDGVINRQTLRDVRYGPRLPRTPRLPRLPRI